MKRIFTAAFSLMVAAASFAQVDANRVIAVVNGDTINGGEYYTRMEFLPGVGKQMGNSYAEFPPGFLTLDTLITERLFFQLAKSKDVYPSDLAVQDELAARLKQTPDLVTNWTASGRTIDDLKYQIRFELAKFNLATYGITVTDVEVSNYYKKNPDMFTSPKQFKLQVIAVSTPDAKAKVDAELSGGKTFSQAATDLSEDPTKAVGGDYGTVPSTILGDKTRVAIEATKIGQNTDWIESTTSSTQTAYVKFHIVDVIPPQLQPYTPELTRAIRNKRMLQMGSIKNDIEKEMRDLRAHASIDIREKAFADAYQKFIQAYLKESGK